MIPWIIYSQEVTRELPLTEVFSLRVNKQGLLITGLTASLLHSEEAIKCLRA